MRLNFGSILNSVGAAGTFSIIAGIRSSDGTDIVHASGVLPADLERGLIAAHEELFCGTPSPEPGFGPVTRGESEWGNPNPNPLFRIEVFFRRDFSNDLYVRPE